MEKHIKVTVENGVKELIIRNGEAEKIHQAGPIIWKNVTIAAVVEFLSKQDIQEESILDSVLFYSYDGLYMRLKYRLSDANTYSIDSSIVLNPDLVKWGINGGACLGAAQLADFIKMNRHLFESKSIAMELVSALKNIKATVNKAIEDNRDDRGNRHFLIDQVVKSNIPESFNIEVSVFKGQPKMLIPIEVVLDADLECVLISPDLKQIISEQAELLIDAELDKVKEMHPQLRIYQE